MPSFPFPLPTLEYGAGPSIGEGPPTPNGSLMTSTILRSLRTLGLFGLLTTSVAAQAPNPAPLTLERIYASAEFRGDFLGPTRWLDDGQAYTTLEPANGGGRDLVRYETESGARQVLIATADLIPTGGTRPLSIEDYDWSSDHGRLLIYTNSERVWRRNTRGDYWVLERASGRLTKLGGVEAQPSTLMFAKFSPDGERVGYVREHDLYVEELTTGAITRLTTNGSRTTINGTFDWVYEEELDLRDGWRWSPDGQRIAFWQLDATGIREFDLINTTDSLYSQVVPVQYPKAGETNSAARVGVISASGGPIQWLALKGDPRNNYPARMEWAARSDEVVIQYLNRLQNRLDFLMGDANTGAVRSILVEKDSAWVDVVDDMVWTDGGKAFTWASERDGWNHIYRVSRDGKDIRLLTPGAFDVLNVVSIDTRGGYVYYIASPDNPTERYLFRVRLDGRGSPERLSPAVSGSHSYVVSPNSQWAFHTFSAFGLPPSTDLVHLPDHRSVRTLVANTALQARVKALHRGPVTFETISLANGTALNAWVMKPADFDSTRRYPVLFYVYGGPGSQTVLDRWGGARYLWHLMLTQKGYVVASVDNRGTGARGRDFKKVVYGHLGVIETEDQAAAARALAERPWVDPSRIGIWGWSYGGFMSLNGLFRAPGTFHMAIAVAPVTHWQYYDNIYTERYNGLPQDNREGYDKGSPLSYVSGMRGDLLLVHGTGDDNVHYQNSEALINALVDANKPFQFMAYPNRTHSISGGMTSLHLQELLTRYLDDHLMRRPQREGLTP